MREGIAQRPGDIDVIWVYGYGFPVWRGGPMFYADSLGLAYIRDRLAALAKHSSDKRHEPAALLSKLGGRRPRLRIARSQAGMNARPYVWEKSYPPGMRWDTPIETTTLPELDRPQRGALSPTGRRSNFAAAGILYKDLAARRHGAWRRACCVLALAAARRSAFICRTRRIIRLRYLASRGPARASCSSARSMPNAN